MTVLKELENYSYTIFLVIVSISLLLLLGVHIKGLFTSLIKYADNSVLVEEPFVDHLPKLKKFIINTTKYGSTAVFKNPKDERIKGYIIRSIDLTDNQSAIHYKIIPSDECESTDEYCRLPLKNYIENHTYEITLKPFSVNTIGYETYPAYILPQYSKEKNGIYKLTVPIQPSGVEHMEFCS